MIYILSALYCEAEPFIEHFRLKKHTDIHQFQVFSGREAVLIVTGTGPINTAIAVTLLCLNYPPAINDLMVNIGLCGVNNENIKEGTLFICNKITDQSTKFCYYPDMLFNHPFDEAELVTHYSLVKTRHNFADGQPVLSDMESSGIFHAASLFFQPHQLIFIKIVSDFQKGEFISREKASALIKPNLQPITNWICQIASQKANSNPVFTEDEELCLDEIISRLKMSVAMESQLRQIMKYYKLQHGSFKEKLNNYLCEISQLSIRSKNEGKKYFDELKKMFI